MTISRRGLIDRAQQIKHLHDSFGAQVEVFLDQLGNFLIRYFASAVGCYPNTGGFCYTDSVRNLDQAATGQARCHDIFGYITSGIGGGTVNLGRVFTGECTAAVRRCATIGVDNDLAASQAAIALRTANYKTAGRVDQKFDIALDQFFGQYGLDNFFNRSFADGFQCHFWGMLGGQHHRVNRMRFAINILDCYL